MLVKDEKGSINFIDEVDNFVGFRSGQCCCENFGWSIKNTNDEEIAIIENDETFLQGFLFDTKKEPVELAGPTEDGGTIGFLLVNHLTGETLCLELYNHHNGYYAHRWDSSLGVSGHL